MAHQTEKIVNGVLMEVTELDHTAQQVDDAVARTLWLAHANLLDNWYFGNPVDQRGGWVVPPDTQYYAESAPGTTSPSSLGTTTGYVAVTGRYDSDWYRIEINGTTYSVLSDRCVRGYTGAGYGIDRWIADVLGGTVLINSDNVTLIKNVGDAHFAWVQKIEKSRVNSDETVTLSVLIDGELYTNTGTISAAITTVFKNGYVDIYDLDIDGWRYNHYVRVVLIGDTCNIRAIKLELGSEQTLAHQNENGNWVLNEIPNYGQELLKCQRYYYVSGPDASELDGASGADICHASSASFALCGIRFPVTMRATPAITLKHVGIWSSANTNLVGTLDIYAQAITKDGFSFLMSINSGFAENEMYYIKYIADANL